jgi:hypothetical protein
MAYPALYTPHIGLALYGADEVVLENFLLLDQAYGSGGSVNVNGTLVANPNFGSLPPAPLGDTNVVWQVDINGNVSAYVPTPAPGGVTSLSGDSVVYNNALSVGAVTLSLISQVANTALMGPATGANATPTFRALVATDIPALPYGTVTAVTSGNIDSIATVTVGTNTTTPAISFSLSTQSANLVWAGPASGVAATPTFRALVAADIPALPYGTGTVTTFSAGALSPLFTTSVATATTTPALTFALSNAAGGTVFGNATTGAAAPGYTIAPVLGIPGTSTGSIAIASSTASGKYTITAPANAATPTLTLPTTSNVLAGQFAGDNVLYSNTPVGATAAGTLALPTLSTQTANFVFAGPASGVAAAPTFRALVAADIPAITVLWSSLGNAAAALTLANANYATTFNQTSAVVWLWANTTVATVSTTNASPLHEFGANYWTGAASAADTWSIQSKLVAGTNGISRLTFVHAGSSGDAQVVLPNSGSASNPSLVFDPSYPTVGFTSNTAITYFSSNGYIFGMAAAGIDFGSGKVLQWNANANPAAGSADSGISRLGAASLAIGNGTAGDFTGTLKLGTINATTAYQANGTPGVTQTAIAVGTLATIEGIVTTFTGVSDERLKDATLYDGGLSEILAINPIRFTYNELGQKFGGWDKDHVYVGFSAQNVQKSIPEAIQGTEGVEQYLSFDDRPVIAALVNAVKELAARLVCLENKDKQ